MNRTNIYLEDAQRDQLDRRARSEGVSRAELIRRLLTSALAEPTDSLQDDLAALDDTFASVGHDIEFVRGPDDRTRHLDRIGT